MYYANKLIMPKTNGDRLYSLHFKPKLNISHFNDNIRRIRGNC